MQKSALVKIFNIPLTLECNNTPYTNKSKEYIMKVKTIISAVALGTLVSLSAAPMGGGMQNRSSFADFDLNNDGIVTKTELLKVRAQNQEARAKAGYPMRNASNAPSFESIDTNGDGKITSNEFLNFRQNRMGQRGRGMGRGMQNR